MFIFLYFSFISILQVLTILMLTGTRDTCVCVVHDHYDLLLGFVRPALVVTDDVLVECTLCSNVCCDFYFPFCLSILFNVCLLCIALFCRSFVSCALRLYDSLLLA